MSELCNSDKSIDTYCYRFFTVTKLTHRKKRSVWEYDVLFYKHFFSSCTIQYVVFACSCDVFEENNVSCVSSCTADDPNVYAGYRNLELNCKLRSSIESS